MFETTLFATASILFVISFGFTRVVDLALSLSASILANFSAFALASASNLPFLIRADSAAALALSCSICSSSALAFSSVNSLLFTSVTSTCFSTWLFSLFPHSVKRNIVPIKINAIIAVCIILVAPLKNFNHYR